MARILNAPDLSAFAPISNQDDAAGRGARFRTELMDREHLENARVGNIAQKVALAKDIYENPLVQEGAGALSRGVSAGYHKLFGPNQDELATRRAGFHDSAHPDEYGLSAQQITERRLAELQDPLAGQGRAEREAGSGQLEGAPPIVVDNRTDAQVLGEQELQAQKNARDHEHVARLAKNIGSEPDVHAVVGHTAELQSRAAALPKTAKQIAAQRQAALSAASSVGAVADRVQSPMPDQAFDQAAQFTASEIPLNDPTIIAVRKYATMPGMGGVAPASAGARQRPRPIGGQSPAVDAPGPAQPAPQSFLNMDATATKPALAPHPFDNGPAAPVAPTPAKPPIAAVAQPAPAIKPVVAEPDGNAVLAPEALARMAQSPEILLSKATDDQLKLAKGRLMAQLNTEPNNGKVKTWLDNVNAAIQDREDAKQQDESPTADHIWEMAKVADTPEKQGKVLAAVQRAQIPAHTLSDLMTGRHYDRARAEAERYFPADPKKTPEQIGAEIALLGAKANKEQTLADDHPRFTNAYVNKANAGADLSTAGAEHKRGMLPYDQQVAQEKGHVLHGQEANLESIIAARNKKLDPEIKLLETRAANYRAIVDKHHKSVKGGKKPWTTADLARVQAEQSKIESDANKLEDDANREFERETIDIRDDIRAATKAGAPVDETTLHAPTRPRDNDPVSMRLYGQELDDYRSELKGIREHNRTAVDPEVVKALKTKLETERQTLKTRLADIKAKAKAESNKSEPLHGQIRKSLEGRAGIKPTTPPDADAPPAKVKPVF